MSEYNGNITGEDYQILTGDLFKIKNQKKWSLIYYGLDIDEGRY